MSEIECDDLLQELDVYLDGELPEEDARKVEQHLSDCQDCFHRHSFVRSLRELIRRKCGGLGEDLPAGLAERIRGAIRAAD